MPSVKLQGQGSKCKKIFACEFWISCTKLSPDMEGKLLLRIQSGVELSIYPYKFVRPLGGVLAWKSGGVSSDQKIYLWVLALFLSRG